MATLDEFRNKLKEILVKKQEALAPGVPGGAFGVFQMEEDDTDKSETEPSPDEEPKEDPSAEKPVDPASNPPSDPASPPASDPASPPKETPPAPQNNQNDAAKIQQMFKDTGNPEVDYSLTNENNIRLFKFKFTYAGVDVDELMKSDEEKKAGLSTKELESRLSPEQYHYYQQKWKKLRQKFPEIDKREKNIFINNANIMLLIDDKEGQEIPLADERKPEAFKKINVMMSAKFGDTWQDLPEALNFLKSIKINFSKKNPVRTNLLSVKVLEERDAIEGTALIPFNKIYVDVPASVQGFLRINVDNNLYNNSSIFQSLSGDFREADKSVGSMSAIIKGTPTKPEGDDDDKSDSDDSSGGGGGGGGGGIGDTSKMGGDSSMGGGDPTDILGLGGDEKPKDDEEKTGDEGKEKDDSEKSGGATANDVL